MSAFMHSNTHLSRCAVSAAPLVNVPAEELFYVWRRANAYSIKVRYGDKGCAKASGPFDPAAPPLLPEQLLRALRSLAYQCCEYQSWKRSKACSLLVDVQLLLESKGVTSTADNAYWSL